MEHPVELQNQIREKPSRENGLKDEDGLEECLKMVLKIMAEDGI